MAFILQLNLTTFSEELDTVDVIVALALAVDALPIEVAVVGAGAFVHGNSNFRVHNDARPNLPIETGGFD